MSTMMMMRNAKASASSTSSSWSLRWHNQSSWFVNPIVPRQGGGGNVTGRSIDSCSSPETNDHDGRMGSSGASPVSASDHARNGRRASTTTPSKFSAGTRKRVNRKNQARSGSRSVLDERLDSAKTPTLHHVRCRSDSPRFTPAGTPAALNACLGPRLSSAKYSSCRTFPTHTEESSLRRKPQHQQGKKKKKKEDEKDDYKTTSGPFASSSSSSIKKRENAPLKRRHQRNPRRNERASKSVPSTEKRIRNLSELTDSFLQHRDTLTSAQRGKEILTLIMEWSKLWGKHSSAHVESNNNHEHRHNNLHAGVMNVDKLVHLLLDMKEERLNEMLSGLSLSHQQPDERHVSRGDDKGYNYRNNNDDDDDDDNKGGINYNRNGNPHRDRNYDGKKNENAVFHGHHCQDETCTTATLCNIAIHGWSKLSGVDGGVGNGGDGDGNGRPPLSPSLSTSASSSSSWSSLSSSSSTRDDARCDPERAQFILERMEKLHDLGRKIAMTREKARNDADANSSNDSSGLSDTVLVSDPNDVRPTSKTYTLVMNAWSKQSADGTQKHNDGDDDEEEDEEREAIRMIRDLFAKMRRLHRSGENESARPTILTMNTLLDAYARRGMIRQVEDTLKRMERNLIDGDNGKNDSNGNGERYGNNGNVSDEPGFFPDDDDDVDDDVDDGDAIDESAKNIDIAPDAVSYSTAINAWRIAALRGYVPIQEAAERGEEILHRLVRRYERSHHANKSRFVPNGVLIGTVIAMYAKGGRSGGHTDEERYWKRRDKRMIRDGDNNNDNNNGGFDGARNAQRVLDWYMGLEQKFREEDGGRHRGGVHPGDAGRGLNARHFVTVMDAWAKSGAADAAGRVEDLLRGMEKSYMSGNSRVKPSQRCFVVAMDAWSKSGVENAAERAEAILHRMDELYLNKTNADEKMNSFGYNLVMDAYARSGERGASQHAERIFSRMLEYSQMEGNEQLKPDKISYSTLMKAWVNERVPGFAEKVESMLSRMEELSREGDRSVKPDTQAYAIAIDAWSKSGELDAADRATAIVHRIQKEHESGNPNVQLNRVVFNSLINAYAKSKEEKAAEKAEVILDWMEQAYRNGNAKVKPNIISYSSVLQAWANSNANNKLDRAEKILGRIMEYYRKDNHAQQPAYAWNSLMSAVNTSSEPNKAAKALDILSRLEGMGAKPDRATYNHLLKACALTEGRNGVKREALHIAITAFNKLKDGLGASSANYSTLLEVCQNQIDEPEERNRALADVFKRCCEDGRVNQLVLTTLRRTSPDSLFWKLIGKKPKIGSVQVGDIPPAWRENVISKHCSDKNI